MKIGYHASHEQFSPSRLLKLVQLAEKAGFQCVLSSDHFHPWGDNQGESGFAWTWLGAAMHATNLEFGIVNAPGQRYHPAIIAQAVATLYEMFPKRFWMAAGSGQALNENITGEKWPEKAERNKRLEECVDIMRQLWRGKSVTRQGIIKIREAKLFTIPPKVPVVYGAALTEETARWASTWSDGLITVSKPLEELKKMVQAFKEKGTGKPMLLKVQVSYDDNIDDALQGAWEQWRNNIFPSHLLSHLTAPKQFDALGDKVRKEEMEEHVLISNKPQYFIDKINAFTELGFEKIILHNVNTNQEMGIDFFGRKVLPHISKEGRYE